MREIPAKNGKKSRKGGGQVTKKQRKEVRRALRQYDGHGRWAAVLDRVKEYYARTDPPAGNFCGCATWRACGKRT